MQSYKQECAKHGWEPTSDQLLYRCFSAVGEDDKEAAAMQAKYFGGDILAYFFRGRGAAVPPPRPPIPTEGGTDADGKNTGADKGPVGFGLGELRFCGSPETVVQQITAFHEATGTGVLDLAFGGAGLTLQESLKSVRLFATEVLPCIRHLGATASQQHHTTLATTDLRTGDTDEQQYSAAREQHGVRRARGR
ncbi:MAG: hypothetical protein NZ578_06865 [Candidatus Binatia bacterium]|nr:hypothetical protein [Candidatus Binatia bacterium]